jgi:molybdate transport system substrate-binding protein
MRIASLMLLCTLVIPSHAQEITVAAAADLRSALDQISARFQGVSSAHLRIIYGSSGNFYQQIQNGAPFDVFLSANTDYPKKLEAAGLVVPGTYYEYARGKIVLLVPSTSTLDLKQGLKVLLDPGIKKIAIADPNHAPYGQAAVAAFKAEGIYEQVSPKLVTGENISQAVSFVLSGSADVGIAALSLAIAPTTSSRTRFAEISSTDYPSIQQACVVLKSSQHQKLARDFESYIQGAEVGKILQTYGFDIAHSEKASSVQ